MDWVGSCLPASANVGCTGGAGVADGCAMGICFGAGGEARSGRVPLLAVGRSSAISAPQAGAAGQSQVA